MLAGQCTSRLYVDYRCPLCRNHLGKRKLSHAVVARMEMDCPQCKGRIRLNLHRSEIIIVVFLFAIFITLAIVAHKLQSQGLLLFAFGAAMAGALILPVLERVYLKNWPRYAPKAQSPDS
jgi:hypothetical protein